MQNADHVKRHGMMHCWISGITQSCRPEGWYADWWMQVAHIASGQGAARRVDDRRAVILLCPLVHDLHVTDADKFPSKWIIGKEWPTIDERHTLYVKRFFDERFYDREFLSTIWIGNVPEPKRPPDFWCEMMLRNQGVML